MKRLMQALTEGANLESLSGHTIGAGGTLPTDSTEDRGTEDSAERDRTSNTLT